jgi:hypothetical protein
MFSVRELRKISFSLEGIVANLVIPDQFGTKNAKNIKKSQRKR